MGVKYSYLKIRSLRRKGRTWKQICQQMGCCEETVRRALSDDIDAFNAKGNARLKKHRLRNGVEL